jgi:hypothetical protein
MTRRSYQTPEAEALEVDLREVLLYSGVNDMGNNDVFQETLDNDIF